MDSVPASLGAVRLPPGSEIVTDADEEVFIIYSLLQANHPSSSDGKFRGLGHVDSRKDVLDITFDIKLPPTQCSERSRSNPKTAKRLNDSKQKTITVPVVLAQDKTALWTRKGDTGSVLWKASIDFAQLILNQIYSTPDKSIFDPGKLRELHILELGSGTGLLSIVLSPLVGHFTATDVGELVPLIRKNLALSFVDWPNKEQGNNVTVEELDWITLSSATPFQRKRMSNLRPVDVLLVVDCIYHPSLLPHLVESLDHLAISGRTVVVIVVELRAEDVIREFLALWLQRSGWKIWRIGDNTLSMPYVTWVGHKSST